MLLFEGFALGGVGAGEVGAVLDRELLLGVVGCAEGGLLLLLRCGDALPLLFVPFIAPGTVGAFLLGVVFVGAADGLVGGV